MRILHLYYDLMNLYGEYGNITVLNKHLIDQGFTPVIDKKTIGDIFDFNDYDFIYCGSGTEKNQSVALNDLMNRKDNFLSACENAVVLFTGNALEFLGNSIDDKKALAVFDFDTTLTKNRYTGDVVVRNEIFGECVGFINRCSKIDTNDNKRLFEFIFKDQGLKCDDSEGFYKDNIFATYLIGPVLVKNPSFMRYIVERLGKKEDDTFDYKEIAYPFEKDSFAVTLKALKERKKDS